MMLHSAKRLFRPNSTRRRIHYFVDTNVLFLAAKKTAWIQPLFHHAHDNHFYFTETVRKTFEGLDPLIPVPPEFKYIYSELLPGVKDMGYDYLQHGESNPGLLEQFKVDLFGVMEAGYVCNHVVGKGEVAMFLTNNMAFYTEFLMDPERKARLSHATRAFGMDHLIDVQTLDDLNLKLPFKIFSDQKEKCKTGFKQNSSEFPSV